MDLHAGSCWAQIDSRRRRDGLHSPITAYCALPFVLGGLRIGLSIFFDELMNRVDDRVRIFAGRHHDFDAIHKRSEEHTSELQSLTNLVCRLLLEKKKKKITKIHKY